MACELYLNKVVDKVTGGSCQTPECSLTPSLPNAPLTEDTERKRVVLKVPMPLRGKKQEVDMQHSWEKVKSKLG